MIEHDISMRYNKCKTCGRIIPTNQEYCRIDYKTKEELKRENDEK